MAFTSIAEEFNQAYAHHRAGRLAEAERIYRQILGMDPNHHPTINLLGVLAGQAGHVDPGIELVRRAIALSPGDPAYHSNLSKLLHDKGRFEESLAASRKAVQLNPGFVTSYVNLANALKAMGRIDEAIAALGKALEFDSRYADAACRLGLMYREKGQLEEAARATWKAIQIDPNVAGFHLNMGLMLVEMKRHDEAIQAYQKATELAPGYADAHSNLALALKEKGRLEEAILAARRAIELNPNYFGYYQNIGLMLIEVKRFDEAVTALRRCVELSPDNAEAILSLGTAYGELRQWEEAIARYRRVLELQPDRATIHNNIGIIRGNQGRYREAEAAHKKAIELDPQFGDAHWNLALNQLIQGNFETGWREFEWRWKCDWANPPPPVPQPTWRGEELHGRTILLDMEQGLGDNIQFIRYAPMVKARGGRVVVSTYGDLGRVMESAPGVDLIHIKGHPVPPFDYYITMMSLPLAFGTREETIPASKAYLLPEPALVAAWTSKVLFPKDKRKIGLVWAGGLKHKEDRFRSMSLADVAPLGQVPGTQIYSLQKGAKEYRPEQGPLPQGLSFINLGPQLGNFVDTAAVISQLDLVITVDTSVAHLAGALGCPVWLMLRRCPDWRWMLDREDSPWYPTMRIFRQKEEGDWADVVQRMVRALRE